MARINRKTPEPGEGGGETPSPYSDRMTLLHRADERTAMLEEAAQIALEGNEELRFDSPKKRAFLLAFARTGIITEACRAANVPRASHYQWLNKDAEYTKAFKNAEDVAADILSIEAQRRAVEGTEEPIYQQGMLVGHKKVYSDHLLMFLMRGREPDKYNKKSVEVTGKVQHDITVMNIPLTPEWMLKLTGKELQEEMKLHAQNRKLGIETKPPWERDGLLTLPAVEKKEEE